MDALREAAHAARQRSTEARVAYNEAQADFHAALDAWAAGYTEIRPGDVVEEVTKWGRARVRVTRWRVDSISGEWPWRKGDPVIIKLGCTYIGKDGTPGKRTGVIAAGDARKVESQED